jgi:hypothetical protein
MHAISQFAKSMTLGAHILRSLIFSALFSVAIGVSGAQADDGNPIAPAQSNLVNQANAPILSILQVRLQDTYAPHNSRGCMGRATHSQ